MKHTPKHIPQWWERGLVCYRCATHQSVKWVYDTKCYCSACLAPMLNEEGNSDALKSSGNRCAGCAHNMSVRNGIHIDSAGHYVRVCEAGKWNEMMSRSGHEEESV